MSEDAWEKLGIALDDLKRCNILRTSGATKRAREYWNQCFYFMKDLQYRSYDRVSVKQRNWIRNIKSDLLKEFKL